MEGQSIMSTANGLTEIFRAVVKRTCTSRLLNMLGPQIRRESAGVGHSCDEMRTSGFGIGSNGLE